MASSAAVVSHSPDGPSVERFSFHDPEATLLQRFVGRLFRRDFFEQLRHEPLPADRSWELYLFGSSVVQMYRPPPGYPFSRRARDIDITILPRAGRSEGVSALLETPGVIDQAATVLHACLDHINGSKIGDGRIGHDPVSIVRTYSREEIVPRIQGKKEEPFVSEIPPEISIKLAVKPFTVCSPMLAPKIYGNIFHEDLIEVIGSKIGRTLVEGTFEPRDLVDPYNVAVTRVVSFDDPKVVANLRALALIFRAYFPFDRSFSRAALDPSDRNLQNLATRLSVPKDRARVFLFLVAEVIAKVFPLRSQDAPLAVYLSRGEQEFLDLLYGFGHDDEGRFALVRPQIAPALLLQGASTDITASRLKANELLQLSLRQARRDQGEL